MRSLHGFIFLFTCIELSVYFDIVCAHLDLTHLFRFTANISVV